MKLELYFREKLVDVWEGLDFSLGRGADQTILVPSTKWERAQCRVSLDQEGLHISNLGRKEILRIETLEDPPQEFSVAPGLTSSVKASLVDVGLGMTVDEFYEIKITQSDAAVMPVGQLPEDRTQLIAVGSNPVGSRPDTTVKEASAETTLYRTSQMDLAATQILKTPIAQGLWRLVFNSSRTAQNWDFEWSGDPIVIGRSTTADILIPDESISKNGHAKISLVQGQIQIEDLGSSNGIRLNGVRRILRHQASPGEFYLLGDVSLRIEAIDSRAVETERQVRDQIRSVVAKAEVSETYRAPVASADQPVASEKKGLGRLREQYLKLDYKRRLIWLGAVAALAILYLDTQVPQQTPKKPVPKEKSDAGISPKPVSAFDRLSASDQSKVRKHYDSAQGFMQLSRFREAKSELDSLFGLLGVDNDYLDSKALYDQIQSRLLIMEQEERAAERKRAAERVQEQISGWVTQARTFLKEGDVAAAEALWGRIQELDPANVDVEEMRQQLAEQQKVKQAKLDQEASRARRIARLRGRLREPERLLKQERFYEAIGSSRKVLRDPFKYPPVMNRARAIIAEAEGKIQELEGPLLDDAKLFAQSRRRDDILKAEELYKRVLKINPSNQNAQKGLEDLRDLTTKRMRSVFAEAAVLESVGDFKNAKDLYTLIIESAPQDNEYFEKAKVRRERILLLEGEL